MEKWVCAPLTEVPGGLGRTLLVVTVLWGAVDLAAGAAGVTAPPESRPRFMPGEVIVKLKNVSGTVSALSQDVGVTPGHLMALTRLQAQYGLGSSRLVRNPLRHEPCYVVQTSGDVPALCALLNRDPAVEYAQPNYCYRPCREPNDPEYPNQYAHQLIQMAQAWDITTGSRNVVIAVIGTGIDINHPDLKPNIWTNTKEIAGNGIDDDGNGYVDDIHGWNFGDNNNDVSPGTSQIDILLESGHETNVAGVIGAVGNNGIGVCGVNWRCSLMALKLGLFYTSEDIAAALDYAAANGARVANMSFGGDVEGDQLIHKTIDHAYAKGVLLVASAGNSYSSHPSYPAAYYNVLAVASTNGEDTKTDHSSFGPWVDLAAPGTDIVTTEMGGKYIPTAGTSFSSPYVAGVAALLLAYRPHLNSVQVRAILENTADPLDYGDLDPNLAYAGTGRVNAYRALLGADTAYPLGEIVTPGGSRTYTADGNDLALCLFVYGDSYQLDYRRYGAPAWTKLAQGVTPTDPNGLVRLPCANPGIGTYELRLRVARGPLTHTDRKVFDVQAASDHANRSFPALTENIFMWQMSTPLCVDVDGDGRQELVEAYSDLMSDYYGTINIWRDDGSSLPNWPAQIKDATPTSLAVGDINGDGRKEIVAACQYDCQVYAYDLSSGKPVAGKWPVLLGEWYGSYPMDSISNSPVLADLDGDGKSEILIALDVNPYFSSSDGLVALRGDGSTLWSRRYRVRGPLSVADLNKDGKVEIALGGYGPGLDTPNTFILDNQGQALARWPGAGAQGTAIADLDGDGTAEMVFCTDQRVMAVHADRSTVWSTKVADPLDTGGGLCIGDLDGDGHKEVYVTTLVMVKEYYVTRVYGFDYKGHLLTGAGYPKTIMGDPSHCAPLIADIDGDGHPELIVGAADEPLMAWKADGSVVPGFPLLSQTPAFGCNLALADLDGDQKLELLVPSDYYEIDVVDLPAPATDEAIQWGMVRYDPENSGWAVAAPKVGSLVVPAQVKVGQKVEIPLPTSNTTGSSFHWLMPDLPEGARYDANTATIFWQPRVEQAFQKYTLTLIATDGVHQGSSRADVEVLPDALYAVSMDTDPNWTLDAYWGWGRAGSRGGTKSTDPNTGHTGTSVVGASLRTTYPNNLAQTEYATTPPIDCRGFKNIRLNYWRWLTIEWPNDRACLQVSNDGTTWTDLWTPDKSPFLDTAWQFVSYPVPAALGDNQPAVYFRWGLGPTNGSVNYGGWKIDDVQVTGDGNSN